MKACFWRVCGIVSGSIAAALLVLTATIAIRENPPMSPRYTVLAAVIVTLGVGGILQIGIARVLRALHDLRSEAGVASYLEHTQEEMEAARRLSNVRRLS